MDDMEWDVTYDNPTYDETDYDDKVNRTFQDFTSDLPLQTGKQPITYSQKTRLIQSVAEDFYKKAADNGVLLQNWV